MQHHLQPKKFNLFILFAFFATSTINDQQKDSTDLMSTLEKTADSNDINYTIATFKSTRLINGHTVETLGKGVLDVRISHRFGKLNDGSYELFGLDNATMRMGLDYGISPNLMVGIGRSTHEKTFDAFFKVKLLKQSSGKKNVPFTIDYIPTIAIKTLHWTDLSKHNLFSSRLY